MLPFVFNPPVVAQKIGARMAGRRIFQMQLANGMQYPIVGVRQLALGPEQVQQIFACECKGACFEHTRIATRGRRQEFNLRRELVPVGEGRVSGFAAIHHQRVMRDAVRRPIDAR